MWIASPRSGTINTSMRRPGFLSKIKQYQQQTIDARHARTPHVVGFHDLLRSRMHDDVFLPTIGEHRRWLDRHCECEYALDDLLDESGAVIGRAYRFADLADAMWFRMAF